MKWNFWKPAVTDESFTDVLNTQDIGNAGTPDEALYSAYQRVLQSSDLRSIRDIEDHYIVRAVVNLLVADVLEKLPHKNIIAFASSEPKARAALSIMRETNDLDQLLTDMLPALITIGNYHLRVSGQNIEDDVPLGETVTAYKNQRPFKHYTTNEKGFKQELVSHDATSFAHFGLRMKRTRLDLDSSDNKADGTLPSVIRQGSSVFADAFASIRDLELLDTLKSAATTAAVTEGSIIGVSVPSTQKPADVLKAMQHYSQVLNGKKLGHNTSKRLTASDVVNRMGVTKLLPIWGDGKGTINKIDGNNDPNTINDLRESVKDQRKVVMSILGIPFELLFSSDGVTDTSAMLKRYGRYVRLITGIRAAVVNGMTQLAEQWLTENAISFKRGEISCEFVRPITDMTMLDRLEIVSSSLQSMQDLDSYLADLINDDSLDGFISNDMRARLLADGLTLMLGERISAPTKTTNKKPNTAAEMQFPERVEEEYD